MDSDVIYSGKNFCKIKQLTRRSIKREIHNALGVTPSVEKTLHCSYRNLIKLQRKSIDSNSCVCTFFFFQERAFKLIFKNNPSKFLVRSKIIPRHGKNYHRKLCKKQTNKQIYEKDAKGKAKFANQCVRYNTPNHSNKWKLARN